MIIVFTIHEEKSQIAITGDSKKIIYGSIHFSHLNYPSFSWRFSKILDKIALKHNFFMLKFVLLEAGNVTYMNRGQIFFLIFIISFQECHWQFRRKARNTLRTTYI